MIDLQLSPARSTTCSPRSTTTRTINVTAVAVGDHVQADRQQRAASGNLEVQEVGGGTTAADLGLAGINVAANDGDGQRRVRAACGHEACRRSTTATACRLRAATIWRSRWPTARRWTSILAMPTTLGDVLDAHQCGEPGQAVGGDRGGRQSDRADRSHDRRRHVRRRERRHAARRPKRLGLTHDGRRRHDHRPAAGQRAARHARLAACAAARGSARSAKSTSPIATMSRRTSILSAPKRWARSSRRSTHQAAGVTAAINSARNGIVLTDTTGATASNLIVADGDANEHGHRAWESSSTMRRPQRQQRHAAAAADQPGHAALVAQRRQGHRRRRLQDHRHERRDRARSI